MQLASAISTFKAAMASENKKAAVATRFAAWVKNITIDEIRKALFVSLTVGDDDLYVDITPKELEYFHKACSCFNTGPEDQIQMSSIVQHLLQAHKKNDQVLQLNKANLENLVKSHALFPFSENTSLTSDALCCSAILLTSRCESNFKQAVGIGEHYVIRARTPSARLKFIFSSLAHHSPQGMPTHDDVVDVLCRVRYPMQTTTKGQLLRKPIAELSALAERLEPSKEQSFPDGLSTSTMQQLEELVRAFPSPYKHLVTDTDMETSRSLNAEEFVRWAFQVRFLDTLDQVFGTFFGEDGKRKRQRQGRQ